MEQFYTQDRKKWDNTMHKNRFDATLCKIRKLQNAIALPLKTISYMEGVSENGGAYVMKMVSLSRDY